MKHTYRSLSRASKMILLLAGFLFGAAQVAKACHGVGVITPVFTNTGSSILIDGNSDPATCGCGPYFMQAEIAFTAACFTGNTPACSDTGAAGSWNNFPFYYSLLNVPNYNAASGWPDNCVLEPYNTITIPFADLCGGTQYVIRVREYVCGSLSAGPWSTIFTFTTPGTAPSVTLITTASEYTACPGDVIQLNAVATGGCPGTVFTYTWAPTTGLSNPNIANPVLTVQPTSQVYTVTLTSGCGAPVANTSDDTVGITVGPPPFAGSPSALPASVCSGGSSVLTLAGQDPASGIQWQISTNGVNWFNISGATSSTYNTGPITSTLYYQAIVTGSGWWPGSGCGSSISPPVIVTVNPSPVANAGSNATVCSGNCANLTGTGGVSYDWQPVNLTTQNITVCPTSTTVYTLTVTDANGCTGTDQVTVGISLANVTASPDVSICTGSNTILVASGPNGNTYSWTPNSPVIITGANTANPTASPSVTTTFTVTSTNAFGCTAVDSVVVTVTPAPPLTTSNDTAMCAGGTAILNVSGAASYSWNPTNQTTSSISVTPVTTTTYVVTGNTNNCISVDSVVVAVTPPPAVYAGPDFAVCSGTQITLNVSTTGNSYSWQPTASIIGASTAQSILAQPTGNTSYTVTVTGANGCISTDTLDITVNPVPTVGASATLTSLCIGQNTTVSGSGAASYTWIPSVGLLNPNQASTTATPSTTTTYQVIGVDMNGCLDTASITITVNPNPGIYITSTPSECGDSTGTLAFGGVVTGTGPFTYMVGSTIITLPDGGYPPGPVNLTITDANGCVSYETVNIGQTFTASVNASASPTFGVYPLGVQFGASGTGGINTYIWSFGDNSPTANGQTAFNTYANPGIYTVVVQAYNDDPYCSVWDTLYIEVVENATMMLPNVFTPNSDGKNDNFSARVSGVKEINVEIFDRWGKVVYTSNLSGLTSAQQDVDLWNGKSSGGNLTADGVYYYVVKAVGYDQKEYPMTGFVHLIEGR